MYEEGKGEDEKDRKMDEELLYQMDGKTAANDGKDPKWVIPMFRDGPRLAAYISNNNVASCHQQCKNAPVKMGASCHFFGFSYGINSGLCNLYTSSTHSETCLNLAGFLRRS